MSGRWVTGREPQLCAGDQCEVIRTFEWAGRQYEPGETLTATAYHKDRSLMVCRDHIGNRVVVWQLGCNFGNDDVRLIEPTEPNEWEGDLELL